jgi:undecaprenyl pyrophosphate phosphatase UppP
LRLSSQRPIAIPVSVAGLAFNSAIEGPARNLWINSTSLIVMGLLLMVEHFLKQEYLAAGLGTAFPALKGEIDAHSAFRQHY